MVSIGYAGINSFIIPANRMQYVISVTTNNIINLPPLLIQTTTITIINIGTNVTTVIDNSVGFSEMVQPGSSVQFLPSKILNTWTNSGTGGSGISAGVSPLVPVLLNNQPLTSSTGWQATASSQISSNNGPERPFVTSNSVQWSPITAGPEYVQIANVSLSVNVTKFAVSVGPASPSVILLVFSAANSSGGPFTVLSTINTPLIPPNPYIFPISNNNTYYSVYRFTFTFSSVTGAGIDWLQIFGSY